MTEQGPGPTFVIAGAARAGSTAVAEGLRRHPDVFVTQPKEPHFLALAGQTVAFTGPGDDETINRVAITDEAAYRALYPGAGTFVATGEGSVSTLYYHEESVPRAQALNPQLRVIVLLREPVSRAFSSYQYLQVRGYETEPDFMTAVADEPRRIAAGWHHLWHYQGMSRYSEALQHFQRVFGDQLGVWFYEDFDRDPVGVIHQIAEFIGVDPSRMPEYDGQRVNVSGKPKRALVHQALTWAGQHEAVRSTLKRVIPFSLRERVRAANLQPNAVPAAAVAELRPVFADDVEAVETLLHRHVPASWSSS